MGTSYYRLKQTDFDGDFKYSEMKTVNIFKSHSFSVWPNPAAERIEVSFGESTDFLTTENNLPAIKIYNSIGKLVYKESANVASSKHSLNVSSYDEGMYFISLEKNHATVAPNVPNGGSLRSIPDPYLPETYRGSKQTSSKVSFHRTFFRYVFA